MATDERVRQAAGLADKAAEVIDRMKVGSWDSAEALALASIAKSLVVIADHVSRDAGGDPGAR
ncbi:hypothetical protein [Microlunatus speluncae]|uniref:hypothetical protein n=1 Tax=Microlunatus speluncae TaxID=2594267 RepID=UPI0012665782|nr:hypothetical protein [Microlunatus speluncae]